MALQRSCRWRNKPVQQSAFTWLNMCFKVYGKAPNVHIPRPAVLPCLNLGSHPVSHATLLIQRCDMAVQVRGFALRIWKQTSLSCVYPNQSQSRSPKQYPSAHGGETTCWCTQKEQRKTSMNLPSVIPVNGSMYGEVVLLVTLGLPEAHLLVDRLSFTPLRPGSLLWWDFTASDPDRIACIP